MARDAGDVLRFRVRVKPAARRARFGGRRGDGFDLHVTAPPVDGAANEAVVALVAEALGVARRNVRIAHGRSGRSKLIEVVGDDLGACRRRLETLAGDDGVDIETSRG